jgi:hypothetical protein
LVVLAIYYDEGVNMIEIANGEWIADLGAMVCRNISNKIDVEFEGEGKNVTGKIKDMPMDLFTKWAEKPDGERLIQKAVLEAEEVFLTAFFESQLDKQGTYPKMSIVIACCLGFHG